MLDKDLLQATAKKYGFNNVEFVNKDYYSVQVLKIVSQIKSDYCDLVFTGGTCMAKAYNLIERMSEDIDIKISLKDHSASTSSIRKNLSDIKKRLKAEFLQSFPQLKDENVKADHDNRHMVFEIPYPMASAALILRGNVKLELTQFPVRLKPISKSVSSLVAIEQKERPEVESVLCVQPIEILSEKIVSLVRRTCASIEKKKKYFDPTIIRHVYDIYKICKSVDLNKLKPLVKEVSEQDARDFKTWHPSWSANPKENTQIALEELKKPQFEELYTQYTESMIYGKNYPKYKQALKEVSKIILDVF